MCLSLRFNKKIENWELLKHRQCSVGWHLWLIEFLLKNELKLETVIYCNQASEACGRPPLPKGYLIRFSAIRFSAIRFAAIP